MGRPRPRMGPVRAGSSPRPGARLQGLAHKDAPAWPLRLPKASALRMADAMATAAGVGQRVHAAGGAIRRGLERRPGSYATPARGCRAWDPPRSYIIDAVELAAGSSRTYRGDEGGREGQGLGPGLVSPSCRGRPKEGDGDEIAGSCAAAKRRHESAGRVPRRRAPRLAEGRGRPSCRSSMDYLPASSPTTSCARRGRGGGPRTGASSPQGHGPCHEGVDGRASPAAPTAAVSANWHRRRLRVMRRQLELSNEVAAALSGSNEQILRALRAANVDCKLFLRAT